MQHAPRLCLLLLSVLLATPAWSTSVERLDHAQLVEHASTIFWGRCLEVRCEWNAERTQIFTVARFAPSAVLKGERQAVVELKVPGGRLDGKAYVIHGMPTFTAGEEAVVYVTRPHSKSGVCVPVGLGQGYYKVDRTGRDGRPAVARRDTRDLNLVDPDDPQGAGPGRVEHLPLDRLLERVRAEVERQRRASGPR